jgi:hypothetical protein
MAVFSTVMVLFFAVSSLTTGVAKAADAWVSFSPDGKKMIFKDVPDADMPTIAPIENFPPEAKLYANKVWRGQFTKPVPNRPMGEAKGGIFYAIFTKWDKDSIILFLGGKNSGTIVCPTDRLNEFSCSRTSTGVSNTYKIEFGPQNFLLKASDGFMAKFEEVSVIPPKP